MVATKTKGEITGELEQASGLDIRKKVISENCSEKPLYNAIIGIGVCGLPRSTVLHRKKPSNDVCYKEVSL